MVTVERLVIDMVVGLVIHYYGVMEEEMAEVVRVTPII
jgi:hypothetical protein